MQCGVMFGEFVVVCFVMYDTLDTFAGDVEWPALERGRELVTSKWYCREMRSVDHLCHLCGLCAPAGSGELPYPPPHPSIHQIKHRQDLVVQANGFEVAKNGEGMSTVPPGYVAVTFQLQRDA